MLVSWNSSTITWAKRPRHASAIAGLERSSSSARSSRSWKSSAERSLLELLVAGVETLEDALERRSRADRRGDLVRGQVALLLVALWRVRRIADLRQPRVGHPLAAQALVGAERHRRQTPGLERRRRRGHVGVVGGKQAVERLVDRAVAQPCRLGRVEDAEARVEARRQRVRGEQAPAEGVDRHHPGAFGRACRGQQLIGAVAVAGGAGEARAAVELAADARAHLGGGALGEGEREQALDLDPVIDHRGAVTVDQHRRLAGSGAGFEEGVVVARGHRRELLGGRREPGLGVALRRRRRPPRAGSVTTPGAGSASGSSASVRLSCR